jgi:hypothetical protein
MMPMTMMPMIVLDDDPFVTTKFVFSSSELYSSGTPAEEMSFFFLPYLYMFVLFKYYFSR